MRRFWLCFVDSNDFFVEPDAEYRNYATFADGLGVGGARGINSRRKEV